MQFGPLVALMAVLWPGCTTYGRPSNMQVPRIGMQRQQSRRTRLRQYIHAIHSHWQMKGRHHGKELRVRLPNNLAGGLVPNGPESGKPLLSEFLGESKLTPDQEKSRQLAVLQAVLLSVSSRPAIGMSSVRKMCLRTILGVWWQKVTSLP